MESQTITSYCPPVYVTGVMGGLQSMSSQPGFVASQVLVLSPRQTPPGKRSNKRAISPRRELASNLP